MCSAAAGTQYNGLSITKKSQRLGQCLVSQMVAKLDLDDQHAIAVAIKAVSLLDRFAIGLQN